jgi:AcrR family transcriptional regulator
MTPRPAKAAPAAPEKAADKGARPTAKAQRTRARLVAASRSIFERDGFVDARISDIAAAAGVSHGTFYTYFNSKEEIFEALVLELVEDFAAPSGRDWTEVDARTAYEAIETANRTYAEMIRRNAQLMAVWRQAASVNATLGALLAQEDDRVIDRAERGIRRFATAGVAAPDPHPGPTARALGIMVKEFCAFAFAPGQDLDLDEVVETTTRIWCRAIGLTLPGSG